MDSGQIPSIEADGARARMEQLGTGRRAAGERAFPEPKREMISGRRM